MDFDSYIENERIKEDPQEQQAIIYCDDCGADIYKNETYYQYYGENLCEECLDNKLEIEKENFRRIAGE